MQDKETSKISVETIQSNDNDIITSKIEAIMDKKIKEIMGISIETDKLQQELENVKNENKLLHEKVANFEHINIKLQEKEEETPKKGEFSYFKF